KHLADADGTGHRRAGRGGNPRPEKYRPRPGHAERAAPATAVPPAFGVTEPSLGNAAGYHIFDGNGKGHDYVTFTLKGIDQNVPSPNDLIYTLTLNPDCTVTYTVLGVTFSSGHCLGQQTASP